MSSFFPIVASLGDPSAAELLVRQDVAFLLEALEAVPDPRDPRGVRFDLPVVLGLAVFAACCGASTFVEIGEVAADLDPVILAGFGLIRTPPSAATFRRLINTADPDVLDEALCVWASGLTIGQDPPEATTSADNAVAAVEGDGSSADVVRSEGLRSIRAVVCLDGKTLKGARVFDAATGVMHQAAVLEALDQATRTVLAQVEIVSGDENRAGIEMIERLAARPGGLTGVVVIADAKHTTRELAETVTRLGGYWVLTVKGNCGTPHTILAGLPWADIPIGVVTRDKAHGRKETRTLRVTEIPDHITVPLTGTVQAGLLRRTVWRKKTVTTPHARTHQTVLVATSLPAHLADPARLAQIVRGQWLVEALHWQRDVVQGEDRHTARTGHGPRNLACLRNIALTRTRQTGTNCLAKTLRAANRHPERALTAITK